MNLGKLDDSPMFRKQVQASEESAEALRERCQKFYKGCRKYTEGLGEAYDGDIAFASSLETFGGGHDDPISIAVGGPVMTKFTIALREIGTYKEVLRSQVEHMLNDRLMQFVNIDLQDVKQQQWIGTTKNILVAGSAKSETMDGTMEEGAQPGPKRFVLQGEGSGLATNQGNASAVPMFRP